MIREGNTVRVIGGPDVDKAERPVAFNRQSVLFGALILLSLGLIGTWLVWYGTELEHRTILREIRGACERLMPETVERCVDTVIVQRGGARR